MPRLFYIDNIRWTMIVLVLSMHACVTYSPFGSWYYRDRTQMGFGTMVSFAVYQSFLQAFFMALLFFIAGYFAAEAYERKGFVRFVRDRGFRLGIPTLLYMVLIGPLTEYYLAHTWGNAGFAESWWRQVATGRLLGQTGPMWFCAALLFFSILYGLFRSAGGRAPRLTLRDDARGGLAVVAFVLAMAAGTFLIRLVEPEGKAVLNMQLGDFPQYVLMFAAGLAAYRGGWLTNLSERFCRRCGVAALLIAPPLFAALILFGGAWQGRLAAYGGGFNPVSAAKSLWESIVCVGVSLGLLALYRRHFDGRGPVSGWLSDNAFAVYVIHPPVLIGFALLLHDVALHPLPKAALLTALAATACFALAGWGLRKTPYLSAIV
ncbi:MAG: acyltransferase family protein [Alphaproteobacteria bacterium]|nr:acyltransferase family protein [Alphaproteobacteria bacterium]